MGSRITGGSRTVDARQATPKQQQSNATKPGVTPAEPVGGRAPGASWATTPSSPAGSGHAALVDRASQRAARTGNGTADGRITADARTGERFTTDARITADAPSTGSSTIRRRPGISVPAPKPVENVPPRGATGAKGAKGAKQVVPGQAAPPAGASKGADGAEAGERDLAALRAAAEAALRTAKTPAQVLAAVRPLLAATPTGRQALEDMAKHGMEIAFGEMTRGEGAHYSPKDNEIVFPTSIVNSDPAWVASMFVHEIEHGVYAKRLPDFDLALRALEEAGVEGAGEAREKLDWFLTGMADLYVGQPAAAIKGAFLAAIRGGDTFEEALESVMDHLAETERRAYSKDAQFLEELGATDLLEGHMARDEQGRPLTDQELVDKIRSNELYQYESGFANLLSKVFGAAYWPTARMSDLLQWIGDGVGDAVDKIKDFFKGLF